MADMLVTVAELRTALQDPTLDSATATFAIELATGAVQALTGQRLVQVVGDTATVYGSADRVLRLPERPVTAVTSVTYAGSLLVNGTSSGNYRLTGAGLWRNLGWQDYCDVPQPVTVVYSHGYATGAQELQLARGAVLSIARDQVLNPEGGGAVSREQIDDYAVSYAATVGSAGPVGGASPMLINALRRTYGAKVRMVGVW